MADRLSDEDLGDLERLAERAGRHAPLGPWSSEALLRLIAEVRELRAETAYSRLSAADRELVLALPALIRESADTVRADERAKVEREIVAYLKANLSDDCSDAINAIERGEHRR